jgi:radical SAM protein (TIGR01212 family)
MLEKLYNEALAADDIVGLSIGTRPDCVDKPVLDLLESYATSHLIWVEYGLQSAHDETLLIINRGHDARCFARAVAETKNRGINICAHVIVGLPGEGREHVRHTARFLTDLGIDGVKLHLLYVVKNTQLEKMYNRGTYQCLSQERYVDLVCDFLERIPGHVIVQRLTGDPHAHELVAPKWSLDRNGTFKRIHRELEKRDSRQGIRSLETE